LNQSAKNPLCAEDDVDEKQSTMETKMTHPPLCIVAT
jgi:hypothetical protein